MKLVTRSLVRHAHAIAREVSARAVLLSADVIEEERRPRPACSKTSPFRVILITRHGHLPGPRRLGRTFAQVVRVPDVAMTRVGQIKVAPSSPPPSGLDRRRGTGSSA